MVRKDPAFLKRLLATFTIEAEEHVRAMSTSILELEQASQASKQAEIIETIFRKAHSLKGAARTVNQTQIEAICQSLESVFAALQHNTLTQTPTLFELLHRAVDGLSHLLNGMGEQPDTNQSRTDQIAVPHLAGILRQIDALTQGSMSSQGVLPSAPDRATAAPTVIPTVMPTVRGAPTQPETTARIQTQPVSRLSGEATPQLADSVRISASYLESLLLQTEELVAVKLWARQRRADLSRLTDLLSTWDREWTKVRSDILLLSRLQEHQTQSKDESDGQNKLPAEVASVLTFVLEQENWVESLENNLKVVSQAAEQEYRQIGGMVDNLLQEMKQALMMPFSSLLDMMPIVVRDLAHDQGKMVETVVEGGELQVDRRILQEIKDPLIHLVRNCVDHGIEKPEVRTQKEKPRRGRLRLAVTEKENSKIEVIVADDGAGIDFSKVREVATNRGLVGTGATETLDEGALTSLIFRSGLSTSPLITDISGRGLGLAIVQEKVERLGGDLSLVTQPDVGTTFRILLPATLTTFQGLLIRVEQQFFVVPLPYVECVIRINLETIKTVENRATIWLDDQPIAIAPLPQVLELSSADVTAGPTGLAPVVVVRAAGERIALLVNEIVNVQEVLVKSLGPQLARIRNIAGATVLGDGQIALILNIPDVIKSAVRVAATNDGVNSARSNRIHPTGPHAASKPESIKPRSILVVEDSITTRTQLRNILEMAGFQVQTAVDGIDGWTALTTGKFDLVVSDIDMPRLNGLDLTARIRADQKLAELPVVLVTALATREDRTRGVEIGASAYIVKSDFEQSNLLDVIRQLI